MKNLSHVASRFVGCPLMIHPPKLEVIIQGIGSRAGVQLSRGLDAPMGAEAELVASYGRAGGDRDYEVIDGIAVIPVQGTLMKRTSGLQAYSGCASYLDFQSQIGQAIEDGGVRGILLDVDSPGGETSGCFELADYIYSVRDSKPIYAIANDCALSAAYAIASSASKVFVTRTGAVGSIGVYALHVDQADFDKEIGAKYTYVFAGEKKVDGNPHEPLSDRAKGDIQSEVDREYGMFVAAVARNRKADKKAIIGTQAGLLWADAALPLLADAVGTFDDAMSALRKAAGLPAESSIAAAAAIPTKGESTMKTTEANAADPKKKAEDTTDDEMKKSKGEAPDDTEKQDQEEDEEEMKGKAAAVKSGILAAVAAPFKGRSESDISAIGALCKMAGCPEKAADFLTKKNAKGEFITVAEVSEELTNARAEESEKTVINSGINPNRAGSGSIAALETEAAAFARQNKGVTKEQAFAQALESNPQIYEVYRAEHNARDLARTLEAAGYKLTRA